MFKNVQIFIDVPYGVSTFYLKTVYELFDNLSYLFKSSLLYTILERDMMSIFPYCVKYVRVQVLSDRPI